MPLKDPFLVRRHVLEEAHQPGHLFGLRVCRGVELVLAVRGGVLASPDHPP
jgi:hypothetical protein